MPIESLPRKEEEIVRGYDLQIWCSCEAEEGMPLHDEPIPIDERCKCQILFKSKRIGELDFTPEGIEVTDGRSKRMFIGDWK